MDKNEDVLFMVGLPQPLPRQDGEPLLVDPETGERIEQRIQAEQPARDLIEERKIEERVRGLSDRLQTAQQKLERAKADILESNTALAIRARERLKTTTEGFIRQLKTMRGELSEQSPKDPSDAFDKYMKDKTGLVGNELLTALKEGISREGYDAYQKWAARRAI